jgi:hypothetical protein
MGDGIVKEKTSISSTMELYGCEVDELGIDIEYEIAKHTRQIAKAKVLSEKLYDRAATIRRRMVKVNDAINWNQLMLDDLKRGR